MLTCVVECELEAEMRKRQICVTKKMPCHIEIELEPSIERHSCRRNVGIFMTKDRLLEWQGSSKVP